MGVACSSVVGQQQEREKMESVPCESAQDQQSSKVEQNNNLLPSNTQWMSADLFFGEKSPGTLDKDFVSVMTTKRKKNIDNTVYETQPMKKARIEKERGDGIADKSLPILTDLLFEPELISKIEFPPEVKVSPQSPGEGLVMRPLQRDDHSKKYLNLLSQLTTVGTVSPKDFESQFDKMRDAGLFYIVVLEDVEKKEVIGSATLVLEPKFIHSVGVRGRIEDVVVNGEYRGKQLGKLLVEFLTLLGKHLGCYKMSLQCKDKLVSYYESFGYKKDEGNNFCVQRFE